MLSIPSAAHDLLMSFSVAFTDPTFRRALVLIAGAILTVGDRTVAGMLRTVQGVARGDASTYHRVFSRASWSLWPLAKILARAVLSQIPPADPVPIPIDDTTAQHRGKCVYGKGCHHDAVRSARKHIVFRWGEEWGHISNLEFFIATWIARRCRAIWLNRNRPSCHSRYIIASRGRLGTATH